MYFIRFKAGKYWKILGNNFKSCRRRYNALLFATLEEAKEFASNDFASKFQKDFKVAEWRLKESQYWKKGDCLLQIEESKEIIKRSRANDEV